MRYNKVLMEYDITEDNLIMVNLYNRNDIDKINGKLSMS